MAMCVAFILQNSPMMEKLFRIPDLVVEIYVRLYQL